MDKIKAYTELIDICSKQIISLLGLGTNAVAGTSTDLNTLFVDDDDNLHLVIRDHQNARPIAARLEVIKEMKQAQKV